MPALTARPFSIRMFLPDGDPDGLRLVEKSNWTGVGVVFSRSIYKDVAQRGEFDKPGVYVLVGPSDGRSCKSGAVNLTSAAPRVKKSRVTLHERPAVQAPGWSAETELVTNA